MQNIGWHASVYIYIYMYICIYVYIYKYIYAILYMHLCISIRVTYPRIAGVWMYMLLQFCNVWCLDPSRLPRFVPSFLGIIPSYINGWWFQPLKNISQLGWLFPIYGKRKNVWNHQPDKCLIRKEKQNKEKKRMLHLYDA